MYCSDCINDDFWISFFDDVAKVIKIHIYQSNSLIISLRKNNTDKNNTFAESFPYWNKSCCLNNDSHPGHETAIK